MFEIVPYETMKLLGWITVVLVILSASIKLLSVASILLSRANPDHLLVTNTHKILKKLMRHIYSYHAPFGTVALLTGLLHGYLLLRRFEMSTGYIAWFLILLLGVSGMLMGINRKSKYYQPLRRIHYGLTYLTIVLIVFHIVFMD